MQACEHLNYGFVRDRVSNNDLLDQGASLELSLMGVRIGFSRPYVRARYSASVTNPTSKMTTSRQP